MAFAFVDPRKPCTIYSALEIFGKLFKTEFWNQLPFYAKIALNVSVNGSVCEFHLAGRIRTRELIVFVNKVFDISFHPEIMRNRIFWRKDLNLPFSCPYVDSVGLDRPGAINNDRPSVIRDIYSSEVIQQDFCEKRILRLDFYPAISFMEILHFNEGIDGVYIRLRIYYVVVPAAEKDEIVKCISLIIGLFRIVSSSLRVSCPYVAYLPGNHTRTFYDWCCTFRKSALICGKSKKAFYCFK